MGGKEGIRGYLVQTIIALLESLDDGTWTHVTIEPDHSSEKIDILWQRPTSQKVVQVKSSENQIGKADAENWATELKANVTADDFELILVGPCAQSVAEMGHFNGVSIPCPKNLALEAFFAQAAHLLDKFLMSEGLYRQSPYQREVMVRALTTELSTRSAKAQPLSRNDLISLLTTWIASITGPITSSWERVTFEHQRGIESAIAGTRLGPFDVQACPQFAICDEISTELQRSHFYEIVGIRGCGKSITAWHVAKRFHDIAYSVWRPRASSVLEDLIAEIPHATRALLVIDDAQRFGTRLAERMSERSSASTKLLLVSTVDNPLLSNAICISPKRCVDELRQMVLARRNDIIPIVQAYDDRIGDSYGLTSFEGRVDHSSRQRTPWEFFWVLRGGWRTAAREFASLRQFPHANTLIAIVAVGQIATCDAGISYESLATNANRVEITEDELQKALRYLENLRLIIVTDVIRTKHLSHAYSLIETCFDHDNRDLWPTMDPLVLRAMVGNHMSLKGICWLLGSIRHTDGFRWKSHTELLTPLRPLVERCLNETNDIDWAAGCLARLFSWFHYPPTEILAHRARLVEWSTSGPGPVAYFCSEIINLLINASNKSAEPECSNAARELIEEIDVIRLIEVANDLQLEDFHNFGSLLDRLAYYGPSWAAAFLADFDWARIKSIVLSANADRDFAVDKLVGSIARLAGRERTIRGLAYIDDIQPYITRAINENPCETIQSMHGILWSCLGYYPQFLRGGYWPDADQGKSAKAIVAGLDPLSFAHAIERAIARDFENLARSFEFIHEVDACFVSRIAEKIRESDFLSSTAGEWKRQANELNHMIRFFCIGDGHEPAASWIRKMQHQIEGPLIPIFAAIAPDVATEFHRAGKGVQLVDAVNPEWGDTNLAIVHLAKYDRERCLQIVEQQLSQLEQALYGLYLSPLKSMLSFLRTLHGLSAELFDRLLGQIDLDNPRAKTTIRSLATVQEKERLEYLRLARIGKRFHGRVRELAMSLEEHIETSTRGKDGRAM